MSDVNRYYGIFGLEPGASPEMVKQAYRDLVKIWHPDRFYHNPRLQRTAQERLKEINEAYERLQTFQPVLRTDAFQARPHSNQSQAGRSRISRKRQKMVLVSAVGVLFVVVIYVGGRLSRFQRPEEEASSGPKQMEIDIALEENISTQELRAKGRSFYLAKDYRLALPYFQKAIENNPRHAKTWYHVGYCHYKLGRYREAVQAFQETIRLKPGYAKAHYSLGRTYSKQKRFQDAILAFQEAVRLKPEYAEAYRELGLAYGKQRRFQDAIGALKQAVQLRPGDAALYYNLGRIYLRIGDRDTN